jgi:uncharacterized protein with HEPN domain
MNERDKILLFNIRSEVEFLLEVVDPHDSEYFLNDKQLQYVASMALIKIGESVKSLSKDIKQKNQEIEWREIAGFRDIAVHNYDGLRMEDIWQIATNDVPVLLERVNNILQEEGVEE